MDNKTTGRQGQRQLENLTVRVHRPYLRALPLTQQASNQTSLCASLLKFQIVRRESMTGSSVCPSTSGSMNLAGA